MVLICGMADSSSGGESSPSVDFNREVRPILSEYCFKCHGPDGEARKAGLRLDQADYYLNTSDGDPVIIPGNPSKSELVSRIFSHDPDEVMPPPETKLSLTRSQKETLKKWIAGGAGYADHWAFIHPGETDLSAMADASGNINPIDVFVGASLNQNDLEFSPEASPEKLVRRLHLDLLGLPPSKADTREFMEGMASEVPGFYSNYVDKLLRRSSFGERWARPWLDLARYADSNGFQADQLRDSWAYRDWVIQAFNQNMPYDRFSIEQLAGDLLPQPALPQKIATGFHRTVTCNVEAGVDAERNRVNQVVDRVNTTATVWLGLTLECAQCHDHKYDPLSMKDYYSFFAFFNNTPLEVELPSGINDVQHNFIGPYLDLPLKPDQLEKKKTLKNQIAEVTAQLELLENDPERGFDAWLVQVTALVDTNEIDKNLKKHLKIDPGKRNASQKKAIRQHFYESSDALRKTEAQLTRLKNELANIKPIQTLVMVEMDEPRETRILRRGDYKDSGELVNAGTPSRLPAMNPHLPRNRTGLAKWIVDRNNPLTARVAVNRLWAELWGRGIVETLEDFGTQSEPPTNPELLDWLALYFMESGWDTKALLKVICQSKTYRQSSRISDRHLVLDPANKFYARGARFRMDAERIRDVMLASSGLLSNKMFGPPIMPYQPSGVWRAVGRNAPVWKEMKNEDRWRRGIYIVYRRAAPYPSMVNFDAPDRSACTIMRPRTNTPLQALTLMNDPAYVEMALGLAGRIMAETDSSTFEDNLESLYLLTLSRKPKPEESQYLAQVFTTSLNDFKSNPERAKKLVHQPSIHLKPDTDNIEELAAWFIIATSILNLDEMVTRG